MTKKQAVYLDTETTGLFAKDGAELLEVAIVQADGKVLLDTFVKPKTATQWDDAMAVNHITPEMVANAPTIDQLSDAIIDAIVGRDVYIWNAPFDQQFVGFALEYANQVICAMREYGAYVERVQPQSTSKTGRYKLECAAHDLGVEINGKAHRALTDVFTTIHVHQAWQSGQFDRANLGSSINVPAYQKKD